MTGLPPGESLVMYLGHSRMGPHLEDIATKMDKWSIDECLEHMEELVNDMRPIATKARMTFDRKRFIGYINMALIRTGGRGSNSLKRSAPKVLHYGVGFQLSRIFSFLGYRDCGGCTNLAGKMDQWGPDKCLEKIEQILDIMEKRAQKSKLFFTRIGGRIAIRLAVKLARASKEETEIVRIRDVPLEVELEDWKRENKKMKVSPRRRG